MAQAAPNIGLTGPSSIRDWLDFREAGRVRLFCGKVEIGQGILTALAQIASASLGVNVERMSVTSGDTRISPNEGYTGSSMSVEVSGIAILRAALSARRILLQEAARVLNAGLDSLTVSDGAILCDGQPTGVDYWRLAQTADLSAAVDETVNWFDSAIGAPIGASIPRIDLAQKLTGGAFIHDIELPGMLHGRVLRPPSFSAHLVSLDEARITGSVPGSRIFQDGNFVGIVAETEYAAVRALERARAFVEWTEEDCLPPIDNWAQYLMRQSSIDIETERGERDVSGASRKFEATYSKPPIAHASMAPSCGLAQFEGGKLTVWNSTQGVFNLRSAIAQALALNPDDVVVIHTHSAGCYGHNGAEDAAMDAALLARAFSPRPVRVQWTREDELTWAPFGTPMAVALRAGLTEDGRIADWSADIWSGTHVKRPGFLPGLVDFIAMDHVEQRIPLSDPRGIPFAFVGSDRNADPPYEIAHARIARHHLPDLQFRCSSLRALGGFANVFATECFMDELAEAAGLDPVDFRLRHLTDSRACRVIEVAAGLAQWRKQEPAGTGQAMGMAFARYKGTAAYMAVVADVEVDEAVRVKSLIGAVDAGLIINPDGVLNQIEGGAVQAASWTLMEEVLFNSRAVTSNTWATYPIFKFTDVPRLHFEIVGGRENDPLGVGEAAQGPTAAAIGNAVARALGVRIRHLPMTREQILRAVS